MSIDLYCSECGSLLGESVTRLGKVEVEPCEKCIDAARDGGCDDGFCDGKEEGVRERSE